MTFSTTMTATALRLLTTYGEAASVSRAVISYLNPLTGIATESTPTGYTGVGHPSTYPEEFIDNTTVFKTDIKFLFSSTTRPESGDVFTIDGVGYTAVSVEKSRAQGSDVYYTVQLRQ